MQISCLTSQTISAVAERVKDSETVYLFLVCIYVNDNGDWGSFFYGYDKIGNVSKYQRAEVRIK